MQDHTKLIVWQRSHALAIQVLGLANEREVRDVPDLRPQLIKSSSSIPATIAEGCGADTRKQFARYLQMSIGSAAELDNHLRTVIAAIPRLNGLARRLLEQLVIVRKMLAKLRRRVVEG